MGMLDPVRRGIYGAMDAGVRWRLGQMRTGTPAPGSWAPADPARFWAESTIGDPAAVRAGRARRGLAGVEVRTLIAASRGPAADPGSRRLIATAHLRPGRDDLPFVLVVHGLAAAEPHYEEWQCLLLATRGRAHAARIDLPLHLRRRPPEAGSGDGYISADLRRTREIVRQSVEDCAAVLGWARREVSPRVSVMGTSLGGLIACLLASRVELASVVAVAPLCEPAETVVDRLPARARASLGVTGEGGGPWGPDRGSARRVVEAALAPITPRLLGPPATPGERIVIVRPILDGVVGDGPMVALAAAWGTGLWSYRHGHISVMTAPGLGRRVRRWLVSPHDQEAAPDERREGGEGVAAAG